MNQLLSTNHWSTSCLQIIYYSHSQVKIYHALKVLLFIVGKFQILGFAFQSNASMSLRDLQINNLKIILTIIRPELWLVEEYQLFQQYGFLLVLSLWLIHKFSVLVLYLSLNQAERWNIVGGLTKQNRWYNWLLIQIIGYYSQAYILIFYIPFSTIVVKSIQFAFQFTNDPTNYSILIISILTLLLVMIDAIFHYSTVEESMSLLMNGFERIRVSTLDYYSFILSILMIVVYGTIYGNQLSLGIQLIFIFIIGTLKLFAQLIDLEYTLSYQIVTVLFCNQVFIVISIQLVIYQLIVQDTQYMTTQLLIVLPLLLTNAFRIHSFQQSQQLLNYFSFRIGNSKQLEAYLIKLINNETFNTQSNQLIYRCLALSFHRRQCRSVDCFCQQDPIFTDTRLMNGVPLKFDRAIIYKQIKTLKKLASNQQVSIEDNKQGFLHQSAYLLHFGWTIFAINQLNQFRGSTNHSKYSENSSREKTQKFRKNDQHCQSISSSRSKQASQADSIIEQTAQKQRRQFTKLMFDALQQSGFVFNTKANYLHQLAKSVINSNFSHSQGAEEQQHLSYSIQQYVLSEMAVQKVQSQIEKVIYEKISFFQLLLGVKALTPHQLLIKTKSLSEQLTKIQNKLRTLFSKFPSNRNQSAICFFEAEIVNNYMEAHRYQSVSSLSDGKLLSLQKNLSNQQLFQDNIYYLLLLLNDDLQTFTIQNASSNVSTKFGKLTSLDSLIPQFINQEHHWLISRFISQGKSKFYRNFSMSFIKKPNGCVQPIELCFDTSTETMNDNLSFALFFKELDYHQAFILVDVNKVIGGITDNLLEKLGYTDQQICSINLAIFNTLNITSLIPKFEEIVEVKQSTIQLSNVDMYFAKFTQLYRFQQIAMGSVSYNLDKEWNDNTTVQAYKSTVVFHKKELYGVYYYIIEIEDIKNSTLSNRETYDNQNTKFLSFPTSYVPSEDEATPQFPNYLQTSEFTLFQNKQLNQLHRQHNIINLEEQQLHQINILSPNQSSSLLQAQDYIGQGPFDYVARQKLFQPQQRFYHSVQNQEQSETNQVQLQEQQKKQGILSDDEDRHIDQQSQSQSLAGARKSIFYKKYDIMNRIIQDRPSTHLIGLISILALQIIIVAVFAIIVLSLVGVDLHRFIKEIEMISLHASFMAPHDMFFAMRVTISAYQQQQREKSISLELSIQLTEPLYQYVGLGYEDLRLNFIEQIQNPYLQDFFTDDQVTVYFMKENDTQIYETIVGFREELQIMIMYQFGFKKTFDRRGSTKGQPFQVFQFANYFNIHDKLEDLTLEIHEYSKQRSRLVSDKWMLLWVTFLVLSGLFTIATIYSNNLYMKQYDTVLGLYKYMDRHNLQVEVDRYKGLLKCCQTEQQLILSYNFNLELKEDSMKEQIMSKQVATKESKIKPQMNNLQLSRWFSSLAYTSILCIFVIFSALIIEKTIQYLNKYDDSTDIFKLFSDLRFRSGNAYLYREIFMRWSNFTYLTSHDYDRLHILLDTSISVMQEYQQVAVNLDYNKYLFSQEFITFFQETQVKPLCQFIDEGYRKFMDPYCILSFDGVMQTGLIKSINFITNAIQNQRAVNNFTARAETVLYELEGSQIITRVFFNISEQFKQGLVRLTGDHLEFVRDFSICFLIGQIVFLYLLFFKLRKRWQQEYTTIRRLVFIIPSQNLLFDDTLERAIRLILRSEEL